MQSQQGMQGMCISYAAKDTSWVNTKVATVKAQPGRSIGDAHVAGSQSALVAAGSAWHSASRGELQWRIAQPHSSLHSLPVPAAAIAPVLKTANQYKRRSWYVHDAAANSPLSQTTWYSPESHETSLEQVYDF